MGFGVFGRFCGSSVCFGVLFLSCYVKIVSAFRVFFGVVGISSGLIHQNSISDNKKWLFSVMLGELCAWHHIFALYLQILM